jgi:response regulator RpfG family c-di-GMP phosphodiesterase
VTLESDSPNDAARPILIVDDEEIVLVALRDTLLREGYEVVASPHAIHALSVLKEREFSVVITDQQMPMVSGLEFLAQVREIQPNSTRILITAVLSQLRSLNQALETQVARVAEQNSLLAAFSRSQEENLRRSIELCVQTMRTFYPTLGNQSRRVSALCAAMSGMSEMTADQKQSLEIASHRYDIGLVGIPRQLIKRWQETPTGLSEAEWTLIHQHPVLGQELAAFVHHLKPVGPTIRGHHERFDGTGYPDRLQRENIPWLARLLAVAVAHAEFDGSPKDAEEMIHQGSGSLFDPEAVRLFLRAVPKAVVPGKQRIVPLSDLRPGMVLAEGIYSENGMLLIPDGQRLTATYIDKLHNYNRINPISQSLLVYC